MVSTVYKTTDGQVFESRKEASAHQSILDNIEMFIEIFTYGSQGDPVIDEDKLKEWLEDGKLKIKFIDE